MKCKLSQLFFLALVGAISVKGYSQTEEERKVIVKGYDLNYLAKIGEEYKTKFDANYAKALAYVKENNLPVSGVNEQGNFFSLKGIDEDTGEILYYQTSNNSTTKSSIQTARAQHLYNGGSLGIDIEGQGMIVGIWDGGQPLAGHYNLGVSRVTNKDNQWQTSTDPEEQKDGEDHATHVAGTMIGSGNGANGSVGTASNNRAKGIASKAYLWSNTWTTDISEMTSQSGQGLLVSNHSYGVGNTAYLSNPGQFGRYSSDSRIVDDLTFTADMYLPVYAAGNDHEGVWTGSFPLVQLNPSKNGLDQLTNEATAKNPVVVAAVDGITDYVSSSYTTNNVVLADFTQWGPTDDFRIKPDISAKGVDVYSSISTSVSSYDTYQGTSMAAPSVTAVFALWQQYRKQLWPLKGFMKAASLKALMAHTASEAGNTEGPDFKFGWGLINAQGGAKVLQDAKANQAVFEELTLQNGATYTKNVTSIGSEPITVTIAWTDRPAQVVNVTDSTTPVLVNDLDVRLERVSNGNVEKPWALTRSWTTEPSAVRADNIADPIEKITYYGPLTGNAQAGEYKVIVTHKGTLVGGSQNFTLVVSGIGSTASSENVVFEDMKIYPNPAKDVLNISADFSTIENASVDIYDMLGKRIYSNNSLFSFDNEASIDVSMFNVGVYLVKVSKDGKTDTRKVVVK